MSRKNYTEREKRELLNIVHKYKAIIENKSTNGVTVEKKNAAWDKIAQEYNSCAEFPRKPKQLITAYQNMKRHPRQKSADDNKAIMATGGGTFTPQLSDVRSQMLAIMGDQLTPLSNNCDSATEYFHNDIDIIQKFEDYKIEVLDEPPQEDIKVTAEPQLEEPPKVQTCRSASSRRPTNKTVYLKQKKKAESTSSMKRKFYQKKLESALIEKRINLINYKISQKKEKLIDLEIKIKEFELQNYQKQNQK